LRAQVAAAAPGDSIVFSVTGTIELVEPAISIAKNLTITGPGGYHHYYAHLKRYPALKVGDWIGLGTVVGYVGDSGNAVGTPPHLHYGVYTSTWTAIDPYPLLKREAQAQRP